MILKTLTSEDTDFGHIVTGDLDIINNSRVKYLMSFGTKFRLNKFIKIKTAIENFHRDLNDFTLKTALIYLLKPFMNGNIMSIVLFMTL